MVKIKKPVIYDAEARLVEEADGDFICDVDAEDILTDEAAASIGNQIVVALNGNDERVAVLEKALEHYDDENNWDWRAIV